MRIMTRLYLATAATCLASSLSLPALAQNNLQSGSNSDATSGSQSSSQSNPTNTNSPTNNNNPVNNYTPNYNPNNQQSSTSGSDATSSSGSSSNSDASSNQSQGANNTQTQGQMANNQQGVNIAFNTTGRKTSKVYTNNAVPLVASSSFSSDYCGGTASGGASAGPIGISIGGAGPVFDKSCQSLRRAEKFGMAAANASNMGQPEMAGRLMSMMIWSICTSDTSGPKPDKSTAMACSAAGLLGNSGTQQPEPAPAMEPAVRTSQGGPTPEAVTRNAESQPRPATPDSRTVASLK